MKTEARLVFPVWKAPPPVPPMTPEQYDRFLAETLPADPAGERMRDLPVAAKFTLVKEDGPVWNESSGNQP